MSKNDSKFENVNQPHFSGSSERSDYRDLDIMINNSNHPKPRSIYSESFPDEPISNMRQTSILSEQSSENLSPLSHEFDSANYISKNNEVLNNERFMNSQFFIDDPLKVDQNGYLDDNSNLFDLTPDQQLAIRELELRRQQLEFEEDYDYALNYDQILDYDVREKLESLNAQLANEPSPPEPEHRNSKVAFKEELISLVAPAEEYDLSENDQEDLNDFTFDSQHDPVQIVQDSAYSYPASPLERQIIPQSISEEIDVESILKVSSDQLEENTYDAFKKDSLNKKEISDSRDDNIQHDIVVSRGGKFQLIGQSDMIDFSDRVELNNDDDYDATNENGKENDNINANENRKLRPVSAPAAKNTRNELWSNSQLDSSNGSVKSEINYRTKRGESRNSKFDVPRVDRELLQRQKEREENFKREQKEKKELEMQKRKEMNEKCFTAWLQNKNKATKEELERKKKEEEEERKQKEKTQEQRKVQALEKEKTSLKIWEQNRRREEKLKEYRLKELQESIIVHTDAECEKAFKEWMKKKNQNRLLKQREEKQKARITRLAMRQCKKSQNLAQVICQTNSFRYLDFYGYPK